MTISIDIPEGMHLEFDNSTNFHQRYRVVSEWFPMKVEGLPTEPGLYQVGDNLVILNAHGQWIDDYGNKLVIGTAGVKGTVYDQPFVRMVPGQASESVAK